MSKREIAEIGQLQKKIAELEVIAAAVETGKKAAKATEQKRAEQKAYVEQNEAKIAAEMTKRFDPETLKVIMQERGFSGTIVDYDVDRVSVEGDVMYFELRLVWLKPDLNGVAALVVGGWNVKTEEPVPDNITFLKDIPAAELTAHYPAAVKAKAEVAASVPPLAPSDRQEQNFYQRNQETVDRAVIGVGAAAATAALVEMIKSLFEETH
jgi:hypothetical protein